MEQSGKSKTGEPFTGYMYDNDIDQFRITTLFMNKGEKEIKYQSTVGSTFMFVMMSDVMMIRFSLWIVSK